MAKNEATTYDFSKKFDQLFLLIEEILKVTMKIAQTQNEAPVEAPEALNIKAENNQLQESVVGIKPIHKLDELMQTFTGIGREVDAQIKEQSNEKPNEAIDLSLNKANKLAEIEIVSGLKEIKQLITDSQIAMTAVAVETEEIKRKSILKSLGEQLLQLDEKREALSNKISDYFTALPGQIKESFASLVVGSLRDITNKMENLTRSLNDCLTPGVEIASNSNLPTDDKSLLPNLEDVQATHSMVDDKSLIEKIRELLSVLEKDIAVINQDAKYLDFALKSKPVVTEESENIVGIRTELDPTVGTFEALNGNEKSGLKTVASVKEEIEDVTLTDYSHHEEEAYHEGVDPDPNVATEITRDEWDQLYDYDQEQ